MGYDGCKIDKWYQHEGLDRVHCILAHIGAVLGDEGCYHPSIHNERCKKALYKAQLSLAELYQAIGEWDEENG